MNILVTGASRGIGKAICQSLNGNIHASARNEDALKIYENYCVCDLAKESDQKNLGQYIEDHNIDVLINNAGEYMYSPVENLNYNDISRAFTINVEAPFYLISKAVPYMKKQKYGRIINIGSISGVVGEANASLYSATKSALIGLSKSLALELAEYGITVNTINPGWVDTNMGNSSAEDGDFSREEWIDCIPQKRFISPEEIAGMIKYLISDDAKGVTGQSINICAGLTCGC